MKPALIFLGHGSTENADSSEPTQRHAETLRQSGRFSEVACAFWKEQPQFHEIEQLVEADEIYVVANFISEGYFTQEIIPREMRLDGPVTQRSDGRVLKYCAPVGVHPSMTRLLLSKAAEVAPDVPPEETAILIVGHGTKLNANSTAAVRAQADLIREGGHGFAEVIDTYMEEPPLISDWLKLTTAPNVVVVPFFIADGLHSFEDIPVMLGIEKEPTGAASQQEVFRQNPHEIGGRQLFYSSAIGTDSHLAEVVLDQIDAFDAEHEEISAAEPHASRQTLAEELARWIDEGKDHLLQVAVRKEGEGYLLHHLNDDPASPDLKPLADTLTILDWRRWNAEGKYRPRPAAKDLRPGWNVTAADPAALLLALDAFYPGAVALWSRQLAGEIEPLPLRDTLARQTGMYRHANEISDEQADTLIREGCAAKGCARTILYPLTEGRPLKELGEEKSDLAYHGESGIPFICQQACCYPTAGARKIVRETWKDREKKA